MDVFQHRSIRKTPNIRWEQKIEIEEIRMWANINMLSNELRQRRWKWIGHVLRMKNEGHALTALGWRPEENHERGRPKTTWRKTTDKERNRARWTMWGEAAIAVRHWKG
jgi:hypothetical protein